MSRKPLFQGHRTPSCRSQQPAAAAAAVAAAAAAAAAVRTLRQRIPQPHEMTLMAMTGSLRHPAAAADGAVNSEKGCEKNAGGALMEARFPPHPARSMTVIRAWHYQSNNWVCCINGAAVLFVHAAPLAAMTGGGVLTSD
jgi:hypothetical protein